jgi:hypothetical protein
MNKANKSHFCVLLENGADCRYVEGTVGRGKCAGCFFWRAKWETPEERQERTGVPWPDKCPVYMRISGSERGWYVTSYLDARRDAKCCEMDKVKYKIICANTVWGIPEL